MNTKKVPSTCYMEAMTSGIKPIGVPYYTRKISPDEVSYYPLYREIFDKDPHQIDSTTISNIKEYLHHYGIDFACSNSLDDKQLHDLANYLWDDYRTFFSREYDRIICTTAFRRLQYKTQVMVNSASDEQRTRLLHSLEVQRIAKKVALGIGANTELAENIAIAHDIGHTPFGHSGEEAISNFLNPCSRNSNKKDTQQTKSTQAGNFDTEYFLHAIQSVKVLNKIASHPMLETYGLHGIGVSNYVLEGVLKHDSDVFSEIITSNTLKMQYDVESLCGIVGVGTHEEVVKKLFGGTIEKKKIPPTFIGSIESQIVAWADKIAYLGHDWEEFLDTKLLEKLMSRINDMVHKMYIIDKTNKQACDLPYIKLICRNLEKIEQAYGNDSSNDHPNDWNGIFSDTVKKFLIEIVNTIADIQDKKQFEHFTKKEYTALKDYFALVLSWTKLINKYPQPEALKYDPIYIFYMYLSNIRTTAITKTVSEALISGTNKKIESLGTKTREEYLLKCNEAWVDMYTTIQDLSFPDEKKKTKVLKKLLKDNVRTCFLVQFYDTNPTVKNRSELVQRGHNGYYDFNDMYCCLLNVIGCIYSQYIGSTRVNFMTQKANKIVSTLLRYYQQNPHMLPYSQRKYFQDIDDFKSNSKIQLTSDQMYHIVDYVAGMTDRMAKKKYDEIKSSDTKWSNDYSSGLI